MQMDYWMPKVYPWRLAFGDFGENGKSLPEGWRFNLRAKVDPFRVAIFAKFATSAKTAKFGKNGQFGTNGDIQNVADIQIGCQVNILLLLFSMSLDLPKVM